MTKTSDLVSVSHVRTAKQNLTLNNEYLSFAWIIISDKREKKYIIPNYHWKKMRKCVVNFTVSFPSNICKELLSKQIIFFPAMQLLFTYVNGTSNVRQQRITLNSEIKVCLCEGGLHVSWIQINIDLQRSLPEAV